MENKINKNETRVNEMKKIKNQNSKFEIRISNIRWITNKNQLLGKQVVTSIAKMISRKLHLKATSMTIEVIETTGVN